MIQRELSKDEIEARSAKLASDEVAREALLEKKRSHNREWNEQLKQVSASISQLALECDTGLAWVPAQEPMFDETAAEPEPTPIRGGRRGGRRSRAQQPEGDGADAA
jgi:hypothetical protein